MAEVKVPGIGPVDKKWVYAGGALAAGIAGYAWWRYLRGGSGGGGDVAEPGSEDYSADGGAYGEDVTGGGGYGGGYGGGSGGGLSSSTTDPDEVITNNAQWAQRAIAALSDVGIETTVASLAIGLYLAGVELSTTQADIVRQALALVGDPPVGTHPIKVNTGTPPPNNNPPDTNPPPANNDDGALHGKKGADLAAPTGLRTWGNGPSKTTVPLEWNPVPGAVGYRVYRSDLTYNVGHSIDTKITIQGLTPGKSYGWFVRAMGVDGKYGPKSSTITLKTKK